MLIIMGPMNLTIDIGNTRAKFVFFDVQGTVVEERSTPLEDFERTLKNLMGVYSIDKCAFCSVAGNIEEVEQALQILSCPILKVTGETELPIAVAYRSRHTLGADRVAAVAGGIQLYPTSDLMIVDAGTCITVDVVSASEGYLGGNISPGVSMRFKAMHAMTARLPLVDCVEDAPNLGIDTVSAMRAGVIQGVNFELEGYVNYWQKRLPHLKVIITGGNHHLLGAVEKNDWVYEHLLVSIGLNSLLNNLIR